MRDSLREFFLTEDKLYPPRLGNLAAWFDALDTTTMLSGTGATITDGGAAALWADKSGNSGENCYVGSSAASNYLVVGNKTVTGDHTFTLDLALDDYTPSADARLASKLSGNNGFDIRILATTGVVRMRVGDGASVTNIDSTVGFGATDLSRAELKIVWEDGVGATFYKDDVQIGDPVAAAKTITNAATSMIVYEVTGGKLYSLTIDGAYDFSPSGVAKKLANGDTFTSGGDTWTLNSSGATGARIAGERDLYQGTLANRPVYLGYSGTKYGYLNGVAGNYFSTPDSAAGDFTTELEGVFRVKMPDYTPATTMALCSKWLVTGNQKSYIFEINATTGRPNFGFTEDGATDKNRTATASPGLTDGQTYWLRFTFLGDNGASGHSVAFYYQADTGTNTPPSDGWTQIGSTVTTAGTASIYVGTALLTVSGYSNGVAELFSGNVFYGELRASVGGAAAVSFNPALYTSGTTFTASTGEVWTLNGGATIVTRPTVYFNGAAHYLKTAAFSYSQPESVYFVGSQVSWTNTDSVLDGAGTNSMRVYQDNVSPQLRSTAGSVVGAIGPALETTYVGTHVFNGTSSLNRLNRDAATTGNAGSGNAGGFTVGSSGSGLGGFGNITASEIILRSAADATATQDRIALYAGRKWGIAV